jgi:hypothetical protein
MALNQNQNAKKKKKKKFIIKFAHKEIQTRIEENVSFIKIN